MKKSLVFAAAALFLATAGASAQAPAGCPALDDEGAVPIELRVGDMVLRAQVSRDVDRDGEGGRVDARLVGCEHDRAVDGVAPGAEPDAAPAAASLLRLLHDFRVGLSLGSSEDGRCVRASFEVEDGAASDLPGKAMDRPLALELCGLGVRLDDRPGRDAAADTSAVRR